MNDTFFAASFTVNANSLTPVRAAQRQSSLGTDGDISVDAAGVVVALDGTSDEGTLIFYANPGASGLDQMFSAPLWSSLGSHTALSTEGDPAHPDLVRSGDTLSAVWDQSTGGYGF